MMHKKARNLIKFLSEDSNTQKLEETFEWPTEQKPLSLIDRLDFLLKKDTPELNWLENFMPPKRLELLRARTLSEKS